MNVKELLRALRWGEVPPTAMALEYASREKARRLLRESDPEAAILLSAHPDGHVREAAVRALLPGGGPTLVALFGRVNDWVPIVAQLAREKTIACLPLASANDLNDALPLVYALTAKGRLNHSELVDAYCREIRRRTGLAAQVRHAHSTGKLGLWAYRRLRGDDEAPSAIVEEGLASGHPGIQIEAAREVARDPAFGLRLVRSPHPQIRRIGLDAAPKEAQEAALTDDHAGVRNDARYLLGRRDYAALYRSELPKPGAISGLGETGTSMDASLLRPLTQSANANVRRRAIEALSRLIEGEAEVELRAALHDPSARVRRAAVEAIVRTTIVLDPQEIIDSHLSTDAAWLLMDRVSPWPALIAVLDHAAAFPRADAWLARWARKPYAPPPTDVQGAEALSRLDQATPTVCESTVEALRQTIRSRVR